MSSSTRTFEEIRARFRARAGEIPDCVTAPDAEPDDILACGCTEVDSQGERLAE